MSTLVNARPRTLIDTVIPERAANSLLTDAALVLLFAGITAGCAQVSIPLPFTPVPITGQTFAVLLTGAMLGTRRGALSMLLYIAWGAIGLPVFAGGAAGFLRIIGPTGGYLLSYPLAAALVGALAERGWDRKQPLVPLALLLGNLVIYLAGVLWLAVFVGGIGSAITKGFLPFIPGDLAKLALTSLLLPGGWKLIRSVRTSE